MIFTHSCQYAIKSCIYLAMKREKIDVVEITQFINSPVPFTSKILQRLAKSNIISSAKGRSGGFYLNDEQYESLVVRDIYAAIEGEQMLNSCALGLSECSETNPCPVHHLAIGIKEKLQHILTLKINELKDTGNIKYII